VEAPAAGDASDLRGALRSTTFWSLTAVFTAGSLGMAALFTHVIPFLLESGLPLATVTAAVGLIGAMQVPGRLLFPVLRRRLGQEWTIASVFFVQAAALAGLPRVHGPAGLALFVAAAGMTNGMATLLRASSVAEVFGSRQYGGISGALSLFTTLARALGPIGAALAHARFGSYPAVFLGLAGLLAATALLPVATRRPTLILDG
jgi:predicted MFS family arabinose efflux permease